MAAPPPGSRPDRVTIMRSQLGRARGLGAAHAGVEHWWVERVTAVALVPLTIWFILSILTMLNAPWGTVQRWAGSPINAALLLALVAATFQHMQLGLQVVWEDYIHDVWRQRAAILATKAVCVILGLIAAVSVLKMAL